ncbi:MAG: sugar phosphate nucleotidyltransferase [Vicinamibacterales bacterium]
MTVVVLAAGRGRRLQASDAASLRDPAQRVAAAQGLKILMPVGGSARPLLDHVLGRLASAGCSGATLVVPPDHDPILTHLARVPPPLPVSLAVQVEPTGTAGAVAAAAAAVQDESFLVVNGDNLYPEAAVRAMLGVPGWGLAAFTRRSLERDSGFPPSRVAAFATVSRDAAGWLTGLVEKPPLEALAPDALVSMNLWRFDRRVFDACRDVPASARGERELPDAVLRGVAQGIRVAVLPVEGEVLDLTTAGDVAVVSRALDRQEVRS